MFLDFYSYQGFVFLVARLILGITLIKHGWPKIRHPLGMKDWLQEMRFPIPGVLSVAIAITEFFGGFLILIGWHVQFAAILIVLDMAMAVVIGKFFDKKHWVGGYELELVLLSVALLLAVMGAGIWSVDY